MFTPTRAGRNVIVVLACVAGTSISRKRSVVRRRTGETGTRRCPTGSAGLRAGYIER